MGYDAGKKLKGRKIHSFVDTLGLPSFTGDVSVIATLAVSQEDKENIFKDLEINHAVKIKKDDIPDFIELERAQTFINGDYVSSRLTLKCKIQIKKGSQRKWRECTPEEEKLVANAIWHQTPDIAYFPTFVFDFPDRVYLTDRGDKVDAFYRQVFQDILDLEGQGFTIQKDIIRRVRNDKLTVSWLDFWRFWQTDDGAAKIQQVIDRASATVTRVVFGRWNRIFKENTGGKEIFITYGLDEGEIKDSKGNITKTNNYDLYAKFQIKDGSRRFEVNDR